MKNKFIKYHLVVGLLLIAAGCNNDFLERYPLDEISNESYWNTENDLKVYNNSIYDLAKDDNNVPIMMGVDDGFDSQKWGVWYVDEYTDNIAPRHPRHGQFQQVRAGRHNVPSSANGDGQWFGYKGWNFLRAINVGMDNYQKADIPQATIDKYVAEARLFRGWFYGDKVSKFGDVPWVDRELNVDSEELFAARTPREEVMANVLADLTFATENLPNDWGDGGAPGRLNRWAALLVKSRVCLFEGTWRKYHGGSNPDMWLQEAANAAKEIMDSGPYTLYSTGDPTTDYNAIHRVTNDLGGVPEVMYWRRYQLGVYTNHAMNYWRSYNGGATKSLVEDYLCTDGLPITLSPLYQGDAQIEDVFVNRDPRLRQTILHPDDVAYYQFGNNDLTRPYPRIVGMAGGQTSETGYQIIKIYDNKTAYATYNTSNTPAITLRFAEVLLNYAEAKAELGTLTQDDLDMTINRLRDRVAMPHMDLANIPVDPRYTNDGVSPLIVEIRRERRIELFMEGFRYDDLRRWKQGKKLEIPDMGIRWDAAAIARYPSANVRSTEVNGVPYIDVYKGTDWEGPVFDESKHYLWPIPLNDLAQNPKIGQNPGW
jgi:starch-binding outer membrane protein, SusD/RagB family